MFLSQADGETAVLVRHVFRNLPHISSQRVYEYSRWLKVDVRQGKVSIALFGITHLLHSQNFPKN